MARLDMSHGFLRYITKNQVDRDTFDKEVQSEKESSKPKRKSDTQKSKRIAQAIYCPPSRGGSGQTKETDATPTTPNTADSPHDTSQSPDASNQIQPTACSTSQNKNLDKKCFSKADIKFKDEKGKTHRFRIHNTDDPHKISQDFCRKMGYPEEYIEALEERIVQECAAYFQFIDKP